MLRSKSMCVDLEYAEISRASGKESKLKRTLWCRGLRGSIMSNDKFLLKQ